jgi:hypothetical protein
MISDIIIYVWISNELGEAGQVLLQVLYGLLLFVQLKLH